LTTGCSDRAFGRLLRGNLVAVYHYGGLREEAAQRRRKQPLGFGNRIVRAGRQPRQAAPSAMRPRRLKLITPFQKHIPNTPEMGIPLAVTPGSHRLARNCLCSARHGHVQGGTRRVFLFQPGSKKVGAITTGSR
jgi:hypothetical protein